MTKAFADFASQHLPETLDFLRRMVAINSFTENAAGINQLGAVTAAEFAGLGFQAEFVPSTVPGYGSHLFLTRHISPTAPTVALVSHLDTVFTAEEEARNNFTWRPEGRRIYGPGTNDIKGGTALIHLVLSALQAVEPGTFAATNWIVALNASEETISAEFGRLCRERFPADTRACLIFEADGGNDDDFRLVAARKGRATFIVEIEGLAAHAGGAHAQGANAIVEAARVVERLAALTDYAQAVTVNVGSIEGGTVANRVPHFARIELEMRAFSPAVYERTKAAILGLAGEGTVRSAEGYPCTVRVAVGNETVPWPRNAATDELFAHWQRTAGELGLPLAFDERGGLSDGNLLWDFVPTLDGLGPRGDQCHCSEHSGDGRKVQEWVDVESFVPKATVNALAILHLLRA